MTSRARIANEAWEALFRAQATVGRELIAADVWGQLSPHEYGVLYALSTAPEGRRNTEPSSAALLTLGVLSGQVARLEASGLRRAKYADAEPRRPRPNPNRGDNLTGTSPYQDSDPGVVADLPLVR